jgi:hypothetical protein
MMISEQQKIKADHLIKILRDHFQQHLIHCIKDKCKCTPWSMHFAYSNLALQAASNDEMMRIVFQELAIHGVSCWCFGGARLQTYRFLHMKVESGLVKEK